MSLSISRKVAVKATAAPAAKRVKNAYGQAHKTNDKQPNWELVEQYLPLVKSVTSRMRIYFPSHVESEEIYSVALTGLISATQNFDSSKNATFGSYAGIRVRGALLDELRRMDWLPRAERVNHKKYRKAVEELEQELKRPASDEEICKALNLSVKEQSKLKHTQTAGHFIPLDATTDQENGEYGSIQDLLSDANAPDARDVVEKRELVELLRVRLDKLQEMPKKVLAMYYLKGMRLAEIALAVGLTESRICQIHAQAITELRTALHKELSD